MVITEPIIEGKLIKRYARFMMDLRLEDGSVVTAHCPGSVTERGLKHLRELRRVVREGHRAVMFYLVNREDGAFFRPAYEKDPVYGKALERALKAGVEVIVRRAIFAPPVFGVGGSLPALRLRGKTLVPLIS